MGKSRVGDPEVPKMVARLYHRMGQAVQAIETLEAYLQQHAGGCSSSSSSSRTQFEQ